MRVFLLNQYYAPDEAATAQLLSDLGSGLARAGHEVTAICCDRSYADPNRRYPRRERIDGVWIDRVRIPAFGRKSRLGRLVEYAMFLLGASQRLAFGKKPDAVVSLSTPPMVAFLGTTLARARRACSVFWSMDVYPDLAFELGVLQAESLAGKIFQGLTRLTLRRCDRIVALGEGMAGRLAKVGARNVSVIPNWADGSVIVPRAANGHPLRRNWGWDGRFVVLYSGNMGLAHEFDTVLGAAHQLRGRTDILFAFVGGGPRRLEIEEKTKQLHLENVELRPYVDRSLLPESLTAGDIHLITLREGMPGLLVPSKIYGILAAGRPTLYVGPAEGEVFDIISSSRCGLRVANGDAAGLVAAILAYAADLARREDEGRRARKLFDAKFTKEHSVGRFVELIEGLDEKASSWSAARGHPGSKLGFRNSK